MDDSMGVERQQGTADQLDLFAWARMAALRHAPAGEGGTRAGGEEERQAPTVLPEDRALTHDLMGRVASPANLIRAARRVRANAGAPGIDGMSVEGLGAWLSGHLRDLSSCLADGSYRPHPVRGVTIPKPGGGDRRLGIPTVIDRLVQQAILQVLDPILDPTFSASSFGFRSGRSAHDALRQASRYVAEGREIVVDLDLEKFFDQVNHDILMSRLARHIGDKRLLKLVRAFLRCGMMSEGVCVVREKGTPQGGPLSPLLANLLLDDLDKELERRGHVFCRYADDCNIYVRSKAAGRRVFASITGFLERRLRLKVNREKSAVAAVGERKVLGYRIREEGRLEIAPESLARVRDRIRDITRRHRGVSLGRMIKDLNVLLTGWAAYFQLAGDWWTLRDLDAWTRRKLRCAKLAQCQRPKTVAAFLRSRGVKDYSARRLASSGKGWWLKSGTPPAHIAMGNAWFKGLGLKSTLAHTRALTA